ncbi:MAG: hypothetical protein JRI68_29915 [Deltaproteobacteria bacterium]|nr:hypothetical protein [Deltaproteobacteria bacterium]
MTEPVAAYLRGKVASADTVVSPITGARAALIQWYLFARRPGDEFERLLDQGLFGSGLLFRSFDGLVRVPTAGLKVYFAAANATALLVPPQLPEPYRKLATTAEAHGCAARGELHYRELLLMSGRPVRLRATVGPIEGAGSYRVPGDAQYAVRDDLEAPTISIDVAEMA